jgi:hypothetical protein
LGPAAPFFNSRPAMKSIACKEQLKALAHFTSGCIRLVDSLFEAISHQ